ncbi:cys-tRNA(Pro)/Cys-tRNA(Cys) deacylase YbaK [bacterium BMS3Bbin02]|nr:cys-tRNA(Pro)/Cys-tRNA(Cys) deacylase YbaK [bacterium BMS3Bbin02]
MDRTSLEAGVIAVARGTGFDVDCVECDPDLADTAAFCETYGFTPNQSANTIVVASRKPEGLVAACVVLATHRLNVNGTVRKKLGARKVSFAPADLTARLTGMTMGGVTPFGLPSEIPVWIDADVMKEPYVIVGGGSRSLKLGVPPQALAALDSAEVVSGLANPVLQDDSK